jgi:hypothetical protein
MASTRTHLPILTITMFELKPGKAAGRRSSRLYHTHRGLTGFQSVKVHVAHEPGTLQCLMGSNKGDENEMWVWQEVGRHTAPHAEPQPDGSRISTSQRQLRLVGDLLGCELTNRAPEERGGPG